MDLKTNGAITQSWRTTLFGTLTGFGLLAAAVAEATGAHPSVRFWALVVSGICGILTAAMSADHARALAEVGKLAKLWAEFHAAQRALAEQQAKAAAPPPPAPTSSVPELDVPFSSEPATPQDTIPEAPPVAVPISPKEPR